MFQIDAFTAHAFGGNPAAVCLLPDPQADTSPDARPDARNMRDDAWMQRVAAEMNLAETAFLTPRPDGDLDLRWFTPMAEVDLCGHATLASAHALWETGRLAPHETARFHTRSGLLTARRDGEWIELDFPASPVAAVPAPPGLLESLGVTATFVGQTPFDYFVEVATEAEVRACAPDYVRLGTIGARGVIVTSRSASSDGDFVSRFFGPAVGINEDPVTGSAHCALAVHWQRKLGKTTFIAHQLSARGGVLRVTIGGDRVKLGGQAVTVLTGELRA